MRTNWMRICHQNPGIALERCRAHKLLYEQGAAHQISLHHRTYLIFVLPTITACGTAVQCLDCCHSLGLSSVSALYCSQMYFIFQLCLFCHHVVRHLKPEIYIPSDFVEGPAKPGNPPVAVYDTRLYLFRLPTTTTAVLSHVASNNSAFSPFFSVLPHAPPLLCPLAKLRRGWTLMSEQRAPPSGSPVLKLCRRRLDSQRRQLEPQLGGQGDDAGLAPHAQPRRSQGPVVSRPTVLWLEAETSIRQEGQLLRRRQEKEPPRKCRREHVFERRRRAQRSPRALARALARLRLVVGPRPARPCRCYVPPRKVDAVSDASPPPPPPPVGAPLAEKARS